MVQVTTMRLNGLYLTWARGAWRLLTTKIIYMHGYRNTGLNWYQPATLKAASERNQMDAEVSGRMRHITQNAVSYKKRQARILVLHPWVPLSYRYMWLKLRMHTTFLVFSFLPR